jgi:hypothetical protein
MHHMRLAYPLLAVLLLAGCSTASSPAPSAGPTASPGQTAGASATAASASPSPSPSPDALSASPVRGRGIAVRPAQPGYPGGVLSADGTLLRITIDQAGNGAMAIMSREIDAGEADVLFALADAALADAAARDFTASGLPHGAAHCAPGDPAPCLLAPAGASALAVFAADGSSTGLDATAPCADPWNGCVEPLPSMTALLDEWSLYIDDEASFSAAAYTAPGPAWTSDPAWRRFFTGADADTAFDFPEVPLLVLGSVTFEPAWSIGDCASIFLRGRQVTSDSCVVDLPLTGGKALPAAKGAKAEIRPGQDSGLSPVRGASQVEVRIGTLAALNRWIGDHAVSDGSRVVASAASVPAGGSLSFTLPTAPGVYAVVLHGDPVRGAAAIDGAWDVWVVSVK